MHRLAAVAATAAATVGVLIAVPATAQAAEKPVDCAVAGSVLHSKWTYAVPSHGQVTIGGPLTYWISGRAGTNNSVSFAERTGSGTTLWSWSAAHVPSYGVYRVHVPARSVPLAQRPTVQSKGTFPVPGRSSASCTAVARLGW
ncbi:hypothetical protein GCM10009664_51180 [Kitasatospora gansuensis]